MLLFLSICTTYAQTQTGQITGQVQDAARQPVVAATVLLKRTTDSAIVKAALSDDKGAYSFEQIAYGNYFVSLTYIGYKDTYLPEFSLQSATHTLQPATLQAGEKTLKGVTVAAKRPLIEQYVDRTVVNVEADIMSAGGSAMDVLEKAPGILVDNQGNISIKGKPGIKIFIDGRATFLSGNDLAAMLRNMQASQLDQLEIISNPSAKYDAAGNGVINIRTKKTNTSGFRGVVSATFQQGRYPGTNENFNFNYRSNKINLFGDLGYSLKKGFEDMYIRRNFRSDDGKNIVSIYDQNSYSPNKNQSYTGKLGLDFYASERTTIGVAVSGFHNPSESTTDNNTLLKNPDGSVQTKVVAPATTKGKWDNKEVNVSLTHRFDSTDHSLQLDATYLDYNTTNLQQFNNYYYDGNGNPSEDAKLFKTDMPGVIKIYTVKADYTRPLGVGGALELGAKYSHVNTDNNAQYFDLKGNSWIRNDVLGNHFFYKEYVYAGYLNYKKTMEQWELQAGLRAEQMQMKGTQVNGNQSFDRKYLQWFPSAFIGYNMDAENKVVLSYSRRIERPDYRSLNPFRLFVDQYTYEEGNPYLKPQYSNNIELSHMYAEGALTTTLLYSKTTDVIQEVVQQNTATNESYVRPENLSTRRILGINVNAQIPLSDNLVTIAYLEFNNRKFDGTINKLPYSLSQNTFNGILRQQVKFPADWKAEVAAIYTSRNIDGTFIQEPTGAISVGVSKDFMKRKATIRLYGADIFRFYKYEATSRYHNVDVYINNRWQTQSLRVTFTYRFNSGVKLSEQEKKEDSAEKTRVKMKDKDK